MKSKKLRIALIATVLMIGAFGIFKPSDASAERVRIEYYISDFHWCFPEIVDNCVAIYLN